MSTKKFLRSDSENDTACSDFDDESIKTTLTQKHPLIPKWTFWVWKENENMTSWEDCLYDIFTVSSIEDFWALQHRLVPVSKLKSGKFNLKFYPKFVSLFFFIL